MYDSARQVVFKTGYFCWQSSPQSIVIIGGSAQGIELAQMFCRYGAQVTLVHRAARLLNREEPEVGGCLLICSAPKASACGRGARPSG